MAWTTHEVRASSLAGAEQVSKTNQFPRPCTFADQLLTTLSTVKENLSVLTHT